jgi:tRNA pseudouridine55 synthase
VSASSGLVIVDKAGGMTSHDVVGRMRRLAHTRKVGHAGTLDPMATGVLVIGVEKATRLLHHLVLTDKSYEATVRLGQATVTDDAEGEVIGGSSAAAVTAEQVAAALGQFTGLIEQVPSAVSAIKVDGQRA